MYKNIQSVLSLLLIIAIAIQYISDQRQQHMEAINRRIKKTNVPTSSQVCPVFKYSN